jgi:holo-[acyl-carrier protein] synthase
VGVDIADIKRVQTALFRTPTLLSRLFTTAEQTTAAGTPRPAASLAARFAAKEAVAKVLEAAAPGWSWTDVHITATTCGRPKVHVEGSLAVRAAALGITRWHVSLSHDHGAAVAVVIAEG